MIFGGKILKMKHIENSDFLYRNNNTNREKLRKMKTESSKKKNQGVTMISLVVTIVILLILSGITIKFALNDNGVIKQSRLASEKYKNSSIQEQVALNQVAKEMQKTQNNTTSGGTSSDHGGNDEELKQQIEDLQNEIENLTDQINALQTQQATGNATTSQVLSGATFSTSNGTGLTGTMKNNGAWTSEITKNGNITIPEGYHNGKGYVSGAGAYNKGISDADARVNTNSASYKSAIGEGFENKLQSPLSTDGKNTFTASKDINVLFVWFSVNAGGTSTPVITTNGSKIYLKELGVNYGSVGYLDKLYRAGIAYIGKYHLTSGQSITVDAYHNGGGYKGYVVNFYEG